MITVTATAGQTLYLNIYNNTNVLKRTGLTLSSSDTTYTSTWNGKDDGSTIVADGTYRIKVSDNSTGSEDDEATTTDTVVVDNSDPTGVSIKINNNAEYSNSTTVSLVLTANDASNLKMQVKNSGSDWPEDWEDHSSSKSWNLTSTDGSKTVSYRVKDIAGNIANAVNSSITLDTTEPINVNVTITGKGDSTSSYSNDVSVSLSIDAEDPTSGLYQIIIGRDVAFTDRSWEEYNTSKTWTLNSGDGEKSVYLKVKDNAGLISSVVSDSIILDTTSPIGLDVSIESAQTYTNDSNVTLTLTATGAAKMQFSNNGTESSWSSWVAYSTEKENWALASGGDGTKTVYFRCKDSAGNIAESVNDTIILDTTAPSISSVSYSGATQSSVIVEWGTIEASTSYVEYGTTTDYGFNTTLNTAKVTSHSVSITGLSPGQNYHYRVKSRDTSGNEGISTDNEFQTTSGTDTTPPDAIVGLSVSDKEDAEKTLTISWNKSSASDFASYKVYRRTTSFTNVTASGVSVIETINSINTNSYEDTDATDGTTFYYAVTAIDTSTPPNENQTVTSVSDISVDDKAPSTTDNIPLGGWQTSKVTITLTATDGGKGVNKTYYTTDGSDPTNSSNSNRTEYISPFSIGADSQRGDGIYTIKYYSYDRNATPNVEGVHTKP